VTTSRKYDLLVERLGKEAEAKRMHKVTQMTEAETAREIAAIVDEAKFAREIEPTYNGPSETEVKTALETIYNDPINQPKRKGGWPKGKPRGPRKPK